MLALLLWMLSDGQRYSQRMAVVKTERIHREYPKHSAIRRVSGVTGCVSHTQAAHESRGG